MARRTLDGTVTHKFMNSVEAEAEKLDIEIKNYKSALEYAGSASPAEFGYQDIDPAHFDNGASGYGTDVQWKSFGLPSGAPQVPPPSLDLDPEHVKSLFDAAKAGAPYKVQIGQKDFASSMRLKTAGAPLTESGLNNQLPAIQVPGHTGLPQAYEPFRLLANIPTVAMTGPSAAYLQHTTNTNEATRVAEGRRRTVAGPDSTENFIKPMKIAATVEATLEILQDHEHFAQWLPVELQRSVMNAESLYLFQANASGGPTASEFNGLLGT